MAKVGKEELQDIQWMVFAGKQTRCFSSMAAIGMAVQSVSRTAQGSGRFRKNKARQERADTRDAVCKNVE